MIQIRQLKLRPGHTARELKEKAAKALHVPPEEIAYLGVVRQSIDARKKPDVRLIYTVNVRLAGRKEKQLLAKCHDPDVGAAPENRYHFPGSGREILHGRPVIVGTGPAGLFCGYLLSQAGYRPLLLERGEDVESRTKRVQEFWEKGVLCPDSNVQFGEGGAGTFSDGKLNTLVKDRDGRNGEVLRIFVENGAPESIRYESRPHVGTDVLSRVVKNMRKKILSWGGEVRFGTKVTDLLLQDGRVCGVCCENGERIETDVVVLAIGHSARDTFFMLHEKGIPMEAKAFAVGFRVEHPQELINLSQYADKNPKHLPPASYKLTAKTAEGRGVYSFCMCPGGYVVNASSEEGRLAVNGMSYSGRDGKNANSAIVVSVTPEDYGAEGPLSGIAFQRKLEEKAFRAAGGAVPVQRYADYAQEAGQGGSRDAGREKKERFVPEDFSPAIKGAWQFADLRDILPPSVRRAFLQGMEAFDRIIPGFADDAVCLSGVESRTSSPVRIPRDESFQSQIRGLYPCGEGAGYAGGITSAAMDGMRIAEVLAARYETSGGNDGTVSE
ncbi:MAG TPA: NAD(P)-binding protein [Candidatus Eisenbergiella merdipullorum]|uniref:NAD(P)-binding protein n=1 Tax=Candidatus Eisenbergiella merdipullorum TaxID=2838553 RepID=A0A9D2L1Y3_9FIRM|nr:NAD(P)-binding protein [Candidatus Eisenbergiella merdipullorum]